MMFHKSRNREHQKKPAVALIAPLTYSSVIQSITNTAQYLAMQGYYVDLFTIKNEMFRPPVFDDEHITIYFMDSSLTEKLIQRNKLTHYLNTLGAFLKGIEIALRLWSPSHVYAFLIGFDPEGVIQAGLLSLAWSVPYVYHSLELYGYDPKAPRTQRYQKVLERWFSQKAVFCLSQDEIRSDILAQENRLDRKKVLVAYNSPLGSCIFPEKDDYLRGKFKISDEKSIVLAVGSLMLEHSIDQIVCSVDNWPENFVLVLHGWFGIPEHEQVIRPEIELRSQKVFLSTDLLDGDQKYRVFRSADIGLVFFNPVNKNYTFAAGSSGKLYDFMRTGVPIIANDIPGMREIIEERECGIVVENPDEIGKVLPSMIQQYELFRKKALENYAAYEFGKCYQGVLHRILSAIEDSH